MSGPITLKQLQEIVKTAVSKSGIKAVQYRWHKNLVRTPFPEGRLLACVFLPQLLLAWLSSSGYSWENHSFFGSGSETGGGRYTHTLYQGCEGGKRTI